MPARPYRFKYEKLIVINSTYHFQVGKHFYSVPYQHVGQKAKIVFDSEDVEVWINMTRIKTYKRDFSEGYTTIPEHMPERHRAYAESKEYNAAYFQKKAREIGPETLSVVNNILSSAIFVQQAYRSCQGLLRLPTRFGKERLENACKMMEPKTAATYKRVKAILESNKDQNPTDASLAFQSYIPANENTRGAEAYK